MSSFAFDGSCRIISSSSAEFSLSVPDPRSLTLAPSLLQAGVLGSEPMSMSAAASESCGVPLDNYKHTRGRRGKNCFLDLLGTGGGGGGLHAFLARRYTLAS